MTDQSDLSLLGQTSAALTRSPSSMQSLMKKSAEQVDSARKATKKILGSYPDYGKAPPDYMVGFAETLSHLTEQEMAWIMDPREGIVTRCQYLPTAADVFELIRERKAKAEQFMPAATTWKRIEDDPNAPWNRETNFERKKRVVAQQLGYNPDERREPQRTINANLVPPTREDLANLKLKTPSGVITPQLRALIAQQDERA